MIELSASRSPHAPFNPFAVQDIITNVLAPLKLLHLEAPFRENGINGQVFMYLTDVRSPFARFSCIAVLTIANRSVS